MGAMQKVMEDQFETVYDRRKMEHIHLDLHQKHHEYIDTLLKKEEQRIAFRKAVIEKTLSSLIWSALVGAVTLLINTFKDHWK